MIYTEEYIDTYVFRIHLNFYLNVFAAILAFYLIFKYSPKEMRAYKYILANISFVSIMLDTYATFIYLPIFLFPAPALCAEGLTKYCGDLWGVLFPYIIWNEIIGFIGASLLTAGFYRYAAIKDMIEEWFTKKTWILIVFSHIFAAIPAISVGVYARMFDWNWEDGLKYYRENWPDAYPLFFTHNCNGLISTRFSHRLYLYVLVVSFAIVITLGYISSFLIIWELRKVRSLLSAETYKMQQQLFYALLMQVIVPTCVLFAPYFSLIMIALFNIDIPFLEGISGFLLEISTLHSFLNTLIICIFIPNYRRVIMKLFHYMWSGLIKRSNQISSTTLPIRGHSSIM